MDAFEYGNQAQQQIFECHGRGDNLYMMRTSSRDRPFASRSGLRLRKPARATLRRDSLISKAKRNRCSIVMVRKIIRWIAVALESSASMVPSMPEPTVVVIHRSRGRVADRRLAFRCSLAFCPPPAVTPARRNTRQMIPPLRPDPKSWDCWSRSSSTHSERERRFRGPGQNVLPEGSAEDW